MSTSSYADITAPKTVTPKQLLEVLLASLASDEPLMIWSAPGLGKSSIANLASTMTDHVYHDLRLPLIPNPPMGGVKAGQIGMREPTREKAWAPLGPCDTAEGFQ